MVHTPVLRVLSWEGEGGGIQYNTTRCMEYSTIQCIQYETMQYDTMQREAKHELINMIYTGLRIFETNYQNGCHNGGHKSKECKYHHISRPKGSEQRPQEATPFQWMTCSPEWPRQNCCEPWMPRLGLGRSSWTENRLDEQLSTHPLASTGFSDYPLASTVVARGVLVSHAISFRRLTVSCNLG